MSVRQTKHPDPTLRTLWGLAKSKELALSDEELHLVVQVQTGKGSMRELTKAEIARVAYVLGQMKDSAGGKKKPPASGNSGTERQRRKVYMLVQELGWNEKRLNGFVKRMFKVDAVEWLNYWQCSGLIEALKAMKDRQGTKEAVH